MICAIYYCVCVLAMCVGSPAAVSTAHITSVEQCRFIVAWWIVYSPVTDGSASVHAVF